MKFNFSKLYNSRRLDDRVLKLLNKNISISDNSEENIRKKIKLCDKPNECKYFNEIRFININE